MTYFLQFEDLMIGTCEEDSTIPGSLDGWLCWSNPPPLSWSLGTMLGMSPALTVSETPWSLWTWSARYPTLLLCVRLARPGDGWGLLVIPSICIQMRSNLKRLVHWVLHSQSLSLFCGWSHSSVKEARNNFLYCMSLRLLFYLKHYPLNVHTNKDFYEPTVIQSKIYQFCTIYNSFFSTHSRNVSNTCIVRCH